ncbi:hypothetical protein C8R43DRAFT_957273 [Mycena crocata]|nr:hypothetical protein C8R43DRAFT_957273 [Mycena crocata]
MPNYSILAVLAAAFAAPLVGAVSSQTYTWKNVKIGGGGGFVPGIVFNPKEQHMPGRISEGLIGLMQRRGNIWTPLLDFATDADWNYWGVAAIATDPVQTNRLYLATGGYTNSFDPKNGNILISTDHGATFAASPLPFKVGEAKRYTKYLRCKGNMPGRGMRLVVDPNSNGILFFGAASGKGLWKSTNFGATWQDSGHKLPERRSGYNSALIGIAWVTFDQTSGTAGSATPRIFVGVANQGSSNIFVTTNGGTTWTAVAGQNTTYLPHKGVISPAEKVLYVSYSNGAGPYDGTLGSVFKYNLTSSVFSSHPQVTGADLYFGFGGVAVDLKTPGTIMVAALNSWWPDGQIFRSTNGGASWSPLWSWVSYPTMNKFYTYSDTLAPWLGPNSVDGTPGDLQIGWMMEGTLIAGSALVIDPFDSNHWLYGTGATIYGGHDLLKWDTTHNVSLSSLADGIEETSVQGLISPPSGPTLISALGDIQGFVHTDLTKAPSVSFTNPKWSTTADMDFAGNKPTNIVRIGTTSDGSQGKQVAISFDSGATWSQDFGAPDNVSADGDTVLWRTNSGQGVLVSQFTNPFVSVSSLPSTAAIASDKLNNSVFYGAAGNSFYLSTDGAKTFTAKGTLGGSASPVKVVVNPKVTGDVWVSTDKGLFHSTNSGTTFTAISGITSAWAIALGAPKTATSYPAIFAAATIGSVGYFRSDDMGINWVQIDDAAHGFGSASANSLTADPRIYGRVYIGTNGRGIFFGDASGAAPPPTATASNTVASSTTTVRSSTTTTVSSTTSRSASTTSSAPPTSTGTQTAFGQCGGTGWTGPTACVSGFVCAFNNDCPPVYSQCVPV